MGLVSPRIFLVDTFGLIFRAYYGRARSSVGSLRTSAGMPTEAVYVFNNMLKAMLEEQQPDYVVAVWEGHGPTFRDEIFPEYKANREAMPEDLALQLPYIERILKAWNVAVLSEDGYEADDTIALLTQQASKHGLEVVIVSSDKDLMQLVGDGVSQWNPTKDMLYKPSDVQEFLGVEPSQVTDLLALKGDSVDNIPGAPGIGDKGAQQLIAAHGDIEGIISHAAEVKRKTYRESLQNHADQIRLSKRLATLDTSGNLRLDLESVRLKAENTDELLGCYRELEFSKLANQLESGPGGPPAEISSRTFESAEQFDEWLAAASGPVAMAVLTDDASDATGQPKLQIGFAAQPDQAWHLPPELLPRAKALLEAGERDIYVHDWKSAIHALGEVGVGFPRAAADTMLMAYLADSSRTNYELKKTVERRLGHSGSDDAGLAANQTLALHDTIRGDIDRMELRSIYEEIELPLAPVLASMEAKGILLESQALAEFSLQLKQSIDELSGEVFELAGRDFNIGSPKQLGDILYVHLGLPQPQKRGKTKAPSTASDVLDGLRDKHAIVGKVLDWRQHTKLKSTYVDALPLLVAADGRLHTTFNPTGSATGRLSSLNPNLQNIPTRTPLGREMRKALVAPPGCQFVSADYSQVELRVMAHLSGDPNLIAAFASGEDLHQRTASEVLGIPPMLVGPDERSRAKAVNFGIIYGLSAFGLARQLNIPQGDARDYIRLYFERYSKVKQFKEATIEQTKRTGFSRTLFGRRRPVPDLDSKNHTARSMAERIAINSPIQGTAADLIKKAMLATDAALKQERLRARIVLQIHDSLLVETPEEEVATVSELLKAEMEAVASLAVPLVVDIKTGPNMRDLEG